ncbi:translation initiation factor IF-2 subunit beta [Candidatus Micrarchaeota archaeon]|nr:translation initiation factor IF-2 subunit beta [Candidatus Micrarchaeota archaeon]
MIVCLKEIENKMQDYEKLLENAYSGIPARKAGAGTGERFEAPVADVFMQGNKTFIRNYGFICSRLRRKPEELAKYLSKELAAPALIESNGEQLALQTKLSGRIINEKLAFYIQNAVLCGECGKPDTHIDLIRGVRVLICEACGARKPIR